AQSAPQRPDEAATRSPPAPAGTPSATAESVAERASKPAAPDHRPHVVWSSAPSAQSDQGFEGAPREE
ncbi:MAG: hypothetical protein WA446_04115, partial [Steroidobacteraceae bacterium]